MVVIFQQPSCSCCQPGVLWRGILAALGPFAFKPTKAVYDAYSKFVIVLAITIKTDHFKNSKSNSSFLLNHELINVFLFTIMLTQMCHTPSIFSVFSQPGDLIFFKFVCSCSSCSWYLASPSWCDRQQDPFENAGWIIVISVEMYLFET